MKGSVFIASFLLLLQGLCGMNYGLALSAATDDETSVIQLAIGSIFPVLLLSGNFHDSQLIKNYILLNFIQNTDIYDISVILSHL